MDLHDLVAYLNRNPDTNLHQWTLQTPELHLLLGIPEGTNVSQWLRDGGVPKFKARRDSLIALLDDVYRDPTGQYLPRYVDIVLDSHDAYCEVEDNYRMANCEACGLVTLRHKQNTEEDCRYCLEPLSDWGDVDMNTNAASIEVDLLAEDQAEDYRQTLQEYCAVTAVRPKLRIEGQNLGWRQQSGFTVTDNDADDLYNALNMDTDFSIRGHWDRQTDTLSLSRYHHDAPTGEYLEVSTGFACDQTGEYLDPDDPNWADVANTLAPQWVYTSLTWAGLLEVVEHAHPHHEVYELMEGIGPNGMTVHLAKVIARVSEELSNEDA